MLCLTKWHEYYYTFTDGSVHVLVAVLLVDFAVNLLLFIKIKIIHYDNSESSWNFKTIKKSKKKTVNLKHLLFYPITVTVLFYPIIVSFNTLFWIAITIRIPESRATLNHGYNVKTVRSWDKAILP